MNRDMRADVIASYYASGGRKYLERLARNRPELYVQLLRHVIPSEIHVTATARYEAVPVPVEARDALPAPGAVLDAISNAILDEDDWLSAPVTLPATDTVDPLRGVAVGGEGA